MLTLNDLERQNGVILRYYTKANYVKLVAAIRIYCLRQNITQKDVSDNV